MPIYTYNFFSNPYSHDNQDMLLPSYINLFGIVYMGFFYFYRVFLIRVRYERKYRLDVCDINVHQGTFVYDSLVGRFWSKKTRFWKYLLGLAFLLISSYHCYYLNYLLSSPIICFIVHLYWDTLFMNYLTMRYCLIRDFILFFVFTVETMDGQIVIALKLAIFLL